MDGNLGWVEWLVARLWRRLPPELQDPIRWAQRLVWSVLGAIRQPLAWAWDQVTSPLYLNAFYIMAASVLGAGLGAVFQYFLAHLYPRTADLGWAIVLFQDVTFIATLSVLGLSIAIVRFLPESAEPIPLLNTCLTIVGATSLLLALAFIGTISFILPDLSFILSNPIYPLVILLSGLTIGLSPVLDQAGIALRRASMFFWRNTIYAVLKILFIVAFAFIAATQGRLGVFLALSVPFGIATLIEAVLFLPRILPGYRPRLAWRPSTLRPMLSFSIGNHVATVIGAAGSLLLPSVILGVIGGSAGATQVAFYYFAVAMAGLLNIIPNATFTSFYAEASQRHSRRHFDERRAVALSLVLLAPAIVFLWVFALPILNVLISPVYALGAEGPFHILLITSVPTFLNTVLATRVRIRKRSLPIIVGSSIATAVTLVLGVYLLTTNGLDGLAIAIVLGQAAPTPYYYYVARHSFAAEETPPIPPVET